MKQVNATLEDCRIWGRFSERFEAVGTGSEFVDHSNWIGMDGHLWSMIKIESQDAVDLVRSYRGETASQDVAPLAKAASRLFFEIKGYKIKRGFFSRPAWVGQALVQFDAQYTLLGFFSRETLVDIFDYLEAVCAGKASLASTAAASL